MSLFGSLVSHLEQNKASLVLENGVAKLTGQKQDWRIRLFVHTHNASLVNALQGRVWVSGYLVIRNETNHILHIANSPYAALYFINKRGYMGRLVEPNKLSVIDWKLGWEVVLSPPSFSAAIAATKTPNPDTWFCTIRSANGLEERYGYHDVQTAWNLILHEGYEPVEAFNS